MVTYSNIDKRYQWTIFYIEKIEDTKGVIRSRKSRKDTQCNGQKEKETIPEVCELHDNL
jgi:hypothetical protein